MKGLKVCILGGAGSIGSELVRQLAPDNEICVFDLNETALFDLVEELKLDGFKVRGIVGDIRNFSYLEETFEDFKPQRVFNAAARKHVAPMEDAPMEAVSVNIEGTWNVIRLCKKYKVPVFVSVSTDKVVNAESIMGATKKVAELMVRNAGYISVRFGNVLNSNGSLIPFWKRRLEAGKSLTVTDERMERYFMSIPEAVSLVIKAAEDNCPGGVYILDMGKSIRIIDLAERMVKELKVETGKEVDIEMIGIRPGEKLKEFLMTEEEERGALKKDGYSLLYAQKKQDT